jgi:hypothetical protein
MPDMFLKLWLNYLSRLVFLTNAYINIDDPFIQFA